MSVRWDAVVKNNTYWSSRRGPDAAATPAPGEGAPVEVQVSLFGGLASPSVPNPLVLRFAAGRPVRDVFDEIGRRLGLEFLRSLVSENGEPFNTCLVFLDGEQVRDMATPISGGAAAATVEIILFREIEGG